MKRGAGILAALAFFYLVNYLDRAAISIAGPSMMASLSLTPSQFGIILTSFGIGYFLAQIPGGVMADRWGAKAVLIVSPILWGLFTGATGLVSSVTAFVVVRLCFGIAEGLGQGGTYKVVGDNFTRERARALGIIVSAATVGPAFAGVIVGALINAYSWQTMFQLLAIPAILAALANLWLIPSKPAVDSLDDQESARDEGGFRQVLGHPSVWLLSLSQFGYNFVTWGYSGWMPSYLALARGIDIRSIGPLASIPFVFAFFGVLIGGWLGSTRLHRARPQFVACCYLLTGLSLLLAYLAPTLEVCMVGLSSTSFFLSMGYGPKGAVMLDLAPPRFRAAYVGIASTGGQLGGAIAPAVIGFLVDGTGSFATGFGMMVTALFVAAVTLLALIPMLASQHKAEIAEAA